MTTTASSNWFFLSDDDRTLWINRTNIDTVLIEFTNDEHNVKIFRKNLPATDYFFICLNDNELKTFEQWLSGVSGEYDSLGVVREQ